MTFDEIVDNVAGSLNITSEVGIDRIGTFVNKRYKRVTSGIGLVASRRGTQTVACVIGSRLITIPLTEKVISVQDLTTTDPVPFTLEEISYEEMLEETVLTDRPTKFAVYQLGAKQVIIKTNFNPQAAFDLSVEGYDRAPTLATTQEPAFSESFHDILEYGAKADELRKMEKVALARDAENDFERRLGELRLHIAVSAHQDIVQGKTRNGTTSSGGGSGSGSGGSGSSSYTQTGAIIFDRDPLAPFAVTAGSAVVANLDADKLDGLDSTDFALQSAFADHNTRHESGGADAIKLDDLAAPDDNTDLNASTTKHGLLKKLSNVATEFLDGTGTFSVPTNTPDPGLCQGRLTLTTGLPVTTADVTAAGTIYFAPYGGSRLALYSGTAWVEYTFTELSLALTATSGFNYDVWVYDNAGTPTLETTIWTNDSTRATALTTQNGVLVKTGATTRRYLGTFRASGANTTEDSLLKRFLWNYYNRVHRPMRRLEDTDSWAYTTATFRQANASTANQLACVIGVAEDALEINLMVFWSGSADGSQGRVGVGEDSTTAVKSGCLFAFQHVTVADRKTSTTSSLKTIPAAGYHFYTWLEYGFSGTVTWFGDNADATISQSGMDGMVRA